MSFVLRFTGAAPRRRLLLLIVILVSFAAGALVWLRPTPILGPLMVDGQPTPGSPHSLSLAQGWSEQTEERAWFTSFGSRLLPYRWLLVLEQAGSPRPFRDDRFLARFGFLPHATSAADPDGLPVGMAKVTAADGQDWAGFGCPVCHTGQVRYRGQDIRIAGGSSRIDLQAFEDALQRALHETLDDPAKFARFAAALQANEAEVTALRAQLVARSAWLDRRVRENQTEVPYGHGRMDAFGQIFNAVGADDLGIPENLHAPDAPVSIPVLWSTPHLARVQWNGASPNNGLAPLVQNVTTALGVYGSVNPAATSKLGYDSNAEIASLGTIQRWNTRLRAPRWPEAVLGRIDVVLAQQGAALYAQQCEACHQRVREPSADTPLAIRLVAVDQVGTDPLMADNFASREGLTGPLQGRPAMFLQGAPLARRAPMIDIVVHLAVGATTRHPWAAVPAVVAGRRNVPASADLMDRRVYKARPLDGIWASAPYLHNGSVPTLADLLLPPAERPARFRVGVAGEFDPVRVGLDLQLPAAAEASEFDTSRRGNSNGGHRYGTGLSATDRQALIEFLKTL